MNHETLFFGAAMAAALALAAPVPAEAAPPSVHQRAQAAADQGPQELYRFVHRTRMIYGLNIRDYDVRQPVPDAEITTRAGDEGGIDEGDDGSAAEARRAAELQADREQLYRDMLHE